jgi:hypothetical protein
MQTDKPDQNNTRGIALASLTILQALIATLGGKGILSAAQINELFETALQGVERPPQSDPGIGHARELIDELAKAMAKRFPRTD